MSPVTDFAVKEKYEYLEGLGNYHQSEYFPDSCPRVNNHPQNPPYGLRTERLSGTSFVAPREHSMHTYMYRVNTSLQHSPYSIVQPPPASPSHLSPNAYAWPTFFGTSDETLDWTQQALLGGNGEPKTKTGYAVWLFNAFKDMAPTTAYSSLDGDVLIVPQSGSLDIQTEMGKLLVRQNEIAVIPRAVRYRVTLPDGPCRGYICELYKGHFRLPSLGVIGSQGLANIRDFQIPVAHFDGTLVDGKAVPDDFGSTWTILCRQSRALWACQQDRSPFDVVAWQGTDYPYKYDLAKFCVLGNALFDEHDPSLYTVLQAPSYQEPGHSILDFAVVSPRWQVTEDSLWLPYSHRNTSVEFTAPIVSEQRKDHHWNQSAGGNRFRPFGAVVHNPMTVHGVTDERMSADANRRYQATKLQVEGVTIMLLESDLPFLLSDWAEQSAVQNVKEGFRGFED